MRIIVDAFGGDNAPLDIIKGSADAVKEYGIDVTLVGNETIITDVCTQEGIDKSIFTIVDAKDVIDNNTPGTEIMKSMSECSMAKGLKLLAAGEGDAFITAGNSGALCVGATLIVKRIKGISRPAFSPIIPGVSGKFMLIDSGANLQVRPEMLRQFGLMGSIYMNKVLGVENPRVALANVGAEEHKGTELQQEAYALLKDSPLNFVGNVEGRDIPENFCDVVVCDGFTGNLILKTYEGVALALMKKIKGIFTKNVKNKVAAAMVLKDVNELKAQFNYSELGGAPILGVKKPVFKAHGNSDAVAFKNAIKLTITYVENRVVEEISENLEKIKAGETND
ncbi:MAG: phosphate acyltransferase PlsX [Eubacteriales bacterium]|nr:phosphate acyltransferase PlsX [Eubacteriales bacterium]